MNDSPIRRKKTSYPMDFLPPPANTLPQTRFTFNNDYHIQPSSIRKYQHSIEQQPSAQSHLVNTNTYSHVHPTPQIGTSGPNPEKGVLSAAELEPESPLVYHLTGKLPGLDQDLLSKPRFSLNDK